MIVNYKIGKIKLELLKEEFIKQIKDSYTLNLSMVLLEEFENLQQENTQLKDKIDRINKLLNEPIFEYDNIPCNIENEIIQLKDILKEK